MAFILEKVLNGQNFEKPELLPSTANETYKAGQVLTLSSGALTAAGNDSDGTQTHICCEDYAAPSSGNRAIHAYPILKDVMVFRTDFSTTPTSLVIGDSVTLASDELRVTATKTKGVCKIYDMLGAAATGDEVLVMFE